MTPPLMLRLQLLFTAFVIGTVQIVRVQQIVVAGQHLPTGVAKPEKYRKLYVECMVKRVRRVMLLPDLSAENDLLQETHVFLLLQPHLNRDKHNHAPIDNLSIELVKIYVCSSTRL